ncbi:hypothetical protein C8T65DRAFT_745794 [Cerioporus squamosus]|nr:hypothetical protein C8T65DRAFT_745794 [Cerioporus squamosus]
MPNLEFLTLSVTESSKGFHGDHSPGLPRILGGIPIRLRALALRSVPFIPGNAFPNLVNLPIDKMTNSVLTIQKLLRLLCNCPRLETFELARTEPLLLTGEVVAVSQTSASSGSDIQLLSDIDVDSPTLFIAELPRLRGLRMGYLNVEHALAILALLRLPKRLAMRLDHMKSSAPYARAAVAYPPWPSLTVPPISALYGVKGLTHLDIIHPGNEGSTMHLQLTRLV